MVAAAGSILKFAGPSLGRLTGSVGLSARPSLSLSFDVKHWFFDRAPVQKFMDRKTRQALQHIGGRIRRIAQTSMRYVTSRKEQERKVAAGERKRAARDPSVSRPGEPPRAIKPHPWIRKNLFYAFEPSSMSVVVGPVGFPRGTGAPQTLEFGGRTRLRNKRRRRRRLGSGGEIDIRGGQVVYTKLRTAGQVDRANRLNEELYGPMFKVVNVAARPFMGPALRKVQPEMPRHWAASVRA